MTLVYPYFQPANDNSIFRFPPLGLGYIASYLKQQGISVAVVDCTFQKQDEALQRIRRSRPEIIGIQTLFSMKEKAIEMAKLLRNDCELLITGGPLPTTSPGKFLQHFDVAVIGEGEQTTLELVNAAHNKREWKKINGIAFKYNGKTTITSPRKLIENLDSLPFPSREFFDHDAYQNYYQRRFGYTTTSVITSRGCPYQCDFCSRPIFGNAFRSRSADNVADEVETIRSLGYSRIWFADDCFTLNRNRLLKLCKELEERKLGIGWECLSRVDTADAGVAQEMKRAGCVRVFLGIESGNDSILAIMKKQATIKQARNAVTTFKKAGIQVGAFFIVGYPGETDMTVLDTVKFASSLPLNYLSFTLPYPIPGTPLFNRVSKRMIMDDWDEPKNLALIKHKLLFDSAFSENKLKFAIVKGMIQFNLHRFLGDRGYKLVGNPFELSTDLIYKMWP